MEARHANTVPIRRSRPEAFEKDGRFTLENDVIAVSWSVQKGRLITDSIQNKLSGQTHADPASPRSASVLDDGWDDFAGGFRTIEKRKFPNGFDRVTEELDQVHSHLGIRISPLASYASSGERVANAGKTGLITRRAHSPTSGFKRWRYRRHAARVLAPAVRGPGVRIVVDEAVAGANNSF
jgi:hypothetical protein